MFKNYLITTLRNIKRYKTYSIINLSGLALGIAFCLLILLWIEDELSYDKFHKKSDSLFRVARVTDQSKNERTPALLGPTLKEEYPEIAEICRYHDRTIYIKVENTFFNQVHLVYVDPAFFDLFTVNFIQGNASAAIPDNSSIVLTQSYAAKLFGNTNPVGKSITVGREKDYVVSGIIEDLPSNSHMKFDCIVNFDSRSKLLEQMFGDNNWRVNAYATYVLLNEGANVSIVNAKIKNMIHSYNTNSESEIYLQPVTNINLNPLEGEGNLKYLYIFSIIALFILGIACINFMNLSTARSSTRAKEIGMRKVSGARKTNLIKQFLAESFILTIFSILIAVGLVILLLPYFNIVSGKQIEAAGLLKPQMLLLLSGITLLTTFLAGGYPALYLSSMTPSSVLQKFTRSGKFTGTFRKYMVIFQFTISALLFIGVTIVYRQLSFMVNADLGYTKDHMLYYVANDDYIQNFESIRSKLITHPGIINASIGTPPMFLDFSMDEITWEGKENNKEIAFAKFHVGHDYVKTIGLKILEGRDFSKQISSDVSDAYLINEEAAKVMGGSVLNKEITFPGDVIGDKGRVIGIINNFHHSSFHEKIIPTVLDINCDWVSTIIVRISSHDIASTIQFLDNEWSARVKDRPFEYTFFDEEIDNFYKKENKMAQLLGTFSALAFIIACLGLFGLVTFMTEQRTKEIGIRKVLGASVNQVVFLISNTFIKMVLAANFIAWPLAYYFMNKWLQNFAYRINLSIWIFILSGLLTFCITLVTVGYQAVKAANANPVESLRYE